MEPILGFLGPILQRLIFETIFFWPGWVTLRILTLGRYPRLISPRRNVDSYMEVEFIVMVGMLAVCGVIALIAKLSMCGAV